MKKADCINLEKATTEAAWIQGLSDRSGMPENQGMLFVFDKPSPQCLWMKGMRFGLDMIWLDDKQQIIKIEQGITPDTFPQTYCSPTPAKYVIELNAGVAHKSALSISQKLNL